MDTSVASLYGKGIFTTVAIRDGEPLLWDKHWRRLSNNAEKIGIDLTEFSENEILSRLNDAIQNDGVIDGRARLTFADESPSSIWPGGSEAKTSLHIITGDLRPVPDAFRLTVSPNMVNSRSPLAGVKSCNYLENLLALDEAKKRGFHEAIRVNELGHITGGCMSNIFWLKGDVLYTPTVATGGLAGTTREFVVENFECREVEKGIDELNFANAIFLTSAGLGIAQVAEFDGCRLQSPKHAITKLLPKQHGRD